MPATADWRGTAGPGFVRVVGAIAALVLIAHLVRAQSATPRVIEVLADHDSRYKIAGQKEPVITVRAGETVLLRITAIKAKDHNRNGAIHGFCLLRAKDRSHVPGWDWELKPGLNQITAAAPNEPGEYVVVCTVICSSEHEGMHMKFVVLPQ